MRGPFVLQIKKIPRTQPGEGIELPTFGLPNIALTIWPLRQRSTYGHAQSEHLKCTCYYVSLVKFGTVVR